MAGAIGVDLSPSSDADVRHDLDVFPYPFTDNEFETVVCIHALEHLKDIPRVMREIHRIMRPGGRLYIETPHFSDAGSYRDPTHRYHLSIRSFDYFIPGTPLFKDYGFYSDARFRMRGRRLILHRFYGFLEGFANAHPDLFEEVLCYVIRGKGICFDLEAMK